MADKKSQRKKSTGQRFSAASRLLGSELRATLQTPPTPPVEEPWRATMSKGKNKGKRKK